MTSPTPAEENKIDDEDFKVELLPEDYAQYDLSFKLYIFILKMILVN